MNLRPNIGGVILTVTVIVGAGIALFLALRFAQSEADRDSLIWQRQMSVVINSREVAVEEWLGEQKKTIGRLAENPNLRIYLANVEAAGTTQDEDSQA
ncbi:MAG TPA: hypothetical protein ENI91_08960, partial [Sphingomonadales bacterium]|nr:hypothetical protein [Sphingomonadales bacterium]